MKTIFLYVVWKFRQARVGESVDRYEPKQNSSQHFLLQATKYIKLQRSQLRNLDMHNVYITHAVHAHGTKFDTTYFVFLSARKANRRSLCSPRYNY